MKMHLFKSRSDIFLSANIKNVVSHINAISEPGTLKSVEQLDRETLIRMDGRLFDLHDLNRYYQNKARNEGLPSVTIYQYGLKVKLYLLWPIKLEPYCVFLSTK